MALPDYRKKKGEGEVGRMLGVLETLEAWVHVGVGFALLLVATFFLGYTVYRAVHFLILGKDVVHTVITTIQDVLLVMIVLEILWTVMTYISSRAIPLEPFLFVAIISSVRSLILQGTKAIEMGVHENVYKMAVEIGIHVVQIFLLTLALYVVRKSRTFISSEKR